MHDSDKLTTALLLALALPVAAQTGAPKPAAQNKPSEPFVVKPSKAGGAQDSNCVDVEVNGSRSPSYNCLEQHLTPPAFNSPVIHR